VCGINISGAVLKYIVVRLWSSPDILILVCNSNNFDRSGRNLIIYKEVTLCPSDLPNGLDAFPTTNSNRPYYKYER
jgi:hypothetical protein